MPSNYMCILTHTHTSFIAIYGRFMSTQLNINIVAKHQSHDQPWSVQLRMPTVLCDIIAIYGHWVLTWAAASSHMTHHMIINRLQYCHTWAKVLWNSVQFPGSPLTNKNVLQSNKNQERGGRGEEGGRVTWRIRLPYSLSSLTLQRPFLVQWVWTVP